MIEKTGNRYTATLPQQEVRHGTDGQNVAYGGTVCEIAIDIVQIINYNKKSLEALWKI
jgi:hypothetical protein